MSSITLACLLATLIGQSESQPMQPPQSGIPKPRANKQLIGGKEDSQKAEPNANPLRAEENRFERLFQLEGGWRIKQEFASGAFAVDFSTNRMWMAGMGGQVNVYDLSAAAMGTGGDVSQWPILSPIESIGSFWGDMNPYGIAFFRGKFWISPRRFYDTMGGTLVLVAQDGEKITLPKLSRNKFAGFVKRREGEPLLGGGGNYSAQGWPFGPTLATMSGKVIIDWGDTSSVSWRTRCPRPPNYSSATKKDEWYCLQPRPGADGHLEGRWCVDKVHAGGLIIGNVVYYWAHIGTGVLDYAQQTDTFAPRHMDRTCLYRFDLESGRLLGFAEVPPSELGIVGGQEFWPDGRIGLAVRSQWASGIYQEDVALKIYRLRSPADQPNER